MNNLLIENGMYYAKFYNTIVMFLYKELRDKFVEHNNDNAITEKKIIEKDESRPIVLFSCLNCANCIQDDGILSRSIVCRLNNKEIVWVGFESHEYASIFDHDMHNGFCINNYCMDFIPKK